MNVQSQTSSTINMDINSNILLSEKKIADLNVKLEQLTGDENKEERIEILKLINTIQTTIIEYIKERSKDANANKIKHSEGIDEKLLNMLEEMKISQEKSQENIAKSQENIKKSQENIKKSQEATNKTLSLLSAKFYVELNPWEMMSNTSQSRTKNRGKSFKLKQPAVCLITGVEIVKLSHILPFSTKAYIYNSLGMNNKLDDDRNLLWLCPAIEEAFDRLKLSIVPDKSNPLLADRYKLHIWDQSIMTTTLYQAHENKGLIIKTEQTIYDFIDVVINLGSLNYRPFKRCLSYQAFMAYLKRGSECEGNLLEKPENFDSSDYEGNFKEKRSQYLEQFLALRKQEFRDEDEDEDEADKGNLKVSFQDMNSYYYV